MKKYLSAVLAVLLLVSIVINIAVINTNRRQRTRIEQCDLRFLSEISLTIRRTEMHLREFISNHEEETLNEIANNLTALQSLLDLRGVLVSGVVHPAGRNFFRFDVIGGLLTNGGMFNGEHINGIFDNGVVDKHELDLLKYLLDGFNDILLVHVASIEVLTERLNEFHAYMYLFELRPYVYANQ